MAKDPRAGTAARPGSSTPPAPGAGPLQVGKRQGVPRDLFRRDPLPACHPAAGGAGNGPVRRWVDAWEDSFPARTQPWRRGWRLSGARSGVFRGPARFQGMKCPKRAENGLRSENRRPAAHPRVLPAPRPSRPCARPAARPGLPPAIRRAPRGCAPLRGAPGGEIQPDPAASGVHRAFTARPTTRSSQAPRQRGCTGRVLPADRCWDHTPRERGLTSKPRARCVHTGRGTR